MEDKMKKAQSAEPLQPWQWPGAGVGTAAMYAVIRRGQGPGEPYAMLTTSPVTYAEALKLIGEKDGGRIEPQILAETLCRESVAAQQ